jgi:hypothetical protein
MNCIPKHTARGASSVTSLRVGNFSLLRSIETPGIPSLAAVYGVSNWLVPEEPRLPYENFISVNRESSHPHVNLVSALQVLRNASTDSPVLRPGFVIARQGTSSTEVLR